jgi:hypothetical protein
MAPGEAPQVGAERGGSRHPLADGGLAAPGPQGVGVVDAVAAGQRRGDQPHRLEPRVGPSRRRSEVDARVDQLSQPEVLPQGHRQAQAPVGHGFVAVEDHLEAVQGVRR